MAGTRGPSVRKELLNKSREAAINAVQTFNSPATTFKAETFIVLMSIAWTYLLHAHYRRKGVEYRCYRKVTVRRKFERTKHGGFKYWGFEDCLRENTCPLDGPTKYNLRFLIGLRNEIVHHQSRGSDERLSGRYLACCLNYERYICDLFGNQHSLDAMVAFTLQFRDLRTTATPEEAVAPLPSNVDKYIQQFDAGLLPEVTESPNFHRVLFVRVLARTKAQANEKVKFVEASKELNKPINEEQPQKVALKEVEREKYLPGKIVNLMYEEGYIRFKMHHHTQLWKRQEARKPGKGYGTMVCDNWYWYDRWLDEVRNHCAGNSESYRADASKV